MRHRRPDPDPDADRRELVDLLASRGIRDRRVLAAVEAVPRERFVRSSELLEAYEDRPLPIGSGQTISQPWVVARTLEALRIEPHHRLLDVGTGSGYAAAVAAHLAGEVVGVERLPELADRARAVLAELGLDVEVVVGDGALGLPDRAPFDAIAVAAAAERVPPALVDQLADGGRMVVPVGPHHGSQRLLLIERRGDEVVESDLGGVRFVPLV